MANFPIGKYSGSMATFRAIEGLRRQAGRLACLALLALGMSFPGAARALPSHAEVKADFQSSDIRLLDRRGRALDQVRTDFTVRRGDWVELDDISIALQRAVIRSEDQRFYEHAGVDWWSVLGAAWDNATSKSRRGASTLTMQLLGFVDEIHQRKGGRSIVRKFDQAMQARELEQQWSKTQILEAYLNLASYRGELVGVDALARVMFQKRASGLDLREAALAAVLLRGPNASAPVLTQRACHLLRDLGQPQDCEDLGDFVQGALSRRAAHWADSVQLAPHYARLVAAGLSGKGERAIRTSLDADLQRFVTDITYRHIQAMSRSHASDAAVVVLDNESGQVLAYLGSTGGLSDARDVDHARALRQAGSTLKPFLYAQALEQTMITAASLLDDSAMNLESGAGQYVPQNYDKQFSGWVSARTALASSLNIPAVRVLLMLTPDAFVRRLQALGLPLTQTGDYYGYSLALGSADVSLLTLTNAYRALANLGGYSGVRYLPGKDERPPTGERVVAEGAAWLVGDILSDRQARSRTFGLDSPLSTPFWTAVKTGTSKDMRDNWCLGWSARYTVGVWVGDSAGASMRNVSGVSGAGPIWHDVMSYLHRRHGSAQPPMPAGVHSRRIRFDRDIEPPRTEHFIADTGADVVRLAASAAPPADARPRIRKPAPGTIFALDPDIPVDNQRIVFEAAGLAGQSAPDVSWKMAGRELGEGGSVKWLPWPGRHRVELTDKKGVVLDSIEFEVRGGRR